MSTPPAKPKPRLTARMVDCLEMVCAYANIGMELSEMESGPDPVSDAQVDAGVAYLRKLITWFDARHHQKTGHWRGCVGPSDHTGPCPRAEDPKEERPPEAPIDPEYEAMVAEVTREGQSRYLQTLEIQRREREERFAAENPEE
jgi:hypothetical protein